MQKSQIGPWPRAETESALNRLDLWEREPDQNIKDAHLADARKSRDLVRERFYHQHNSATLRTVTVSGLRILDERLQDLTASGTPVRIISECLRIIFRLCESCRTLCEETTSFVHAIRDALIPQR
jgi:hypothetical protein